MGANSQGDGAGDSSQKTSPNTPDYARPRQSECNHSQYDKEQNRQYDALRGNLVCLQAGARFRGHECDSSDKRKRGDPPPNAWLGWCACAHCGLT